MLNPTFSHRLRGLSTLFQSSKRGALRRRVRQVQMEPLEPRRLPASLVFANNYGSLGGGVATAEAVAMDQAGNAYVTGEFTGTVSFGGTSLTSAGAGEIYFAKFKS